LEDETMTRTFDTFAQGLADSLTPEQACKLIQIADPLTPEEQAYFAAMSDDDLLAELTE
jgi:hypothetical protein